MNVDYDHSKNVHSAIGPLAALPVLLDMAKPSSLLDVGCGIGTWLRAALDLGLTDILGVDGVDVPAPSLLIPRNLFVHYNITEPLGLGRKFDLALSLEVAEHLEAGAGQILVASLTDHADAIFFSAACPGQPGQHHVNCQWPEYWQKLFNSRGFTCDDAIRWQIWNDSRIEPWYRQNMFLARRDSARAGTEARIIPVIHPEMMPWFQSKMAGEGWSADVEQIQKGRMPLEWYLTIPFGALWAKLKRKLK